MARVPLRPVPSHRGTGCTLRPEVGRRQVADAAGGSYVSIEWPAPLDVVRRLIEVSEQRGEAVGGVVVLVGGSAMAAHGIRAESLDVDAYTPTASEACVAQVEAEYRGRYGPQFRLDVTTVENIWGLIMIRDLAEAPLITHIVSASGRTYAVRALSVEDLYVLKVASGRRRDSDDLPLIAPHTGADAIVARFNTLLAGIGDRKAIPGIADALVGSLAAHYALPSARIIDELAVSDELKEDLREAHHAA